MRSFCMFRLALTLAFRGVLYEFGSHCHNPFSYSYQTSFRNARIPSRWLARIFFWPVSEEVLRVTPSPSYTRSISSSIALVANFSKRVSEKKDSRKPKKPQAVTWRWGNGIRRWIFAVDYQRYIFCNVISLMYTISKLLLVARVACGLNNLSYFSTSETFHDLRISIAWVTQLFVDRMWGRSAGCIVLFCFVLFWTSLMGAILAKEVILAKKERTWKNWVLLGKKDHTW